MITFQYPNGFTTSFTEQEKFQLVVAAALKFVDFYSRNSLITGQLPSAEYGSSEFLEDLTVEVFDDSFSVNVTPGEE